MYELDSGLCKAVIVRAFKLPPITRVVKQSDFLQITVLVSYMKELQSILL